MNPTGGHGHILTFSVGDNIEKGVTANVGLKKTTGFNSINATISKKKPKTYYIMTHEIPPIPSPHGQSYLLSSQSIVNLPDASYNKIQQSVYRRFN